MTWQNVGYVTTTGYGNAFATPKGHRNLQTAISLLRLRAALSAYECGHLRVCICPSFSMVGLYMCTEEKTIGNTATGNCRHYGDHGDQGRRTALLRQTVDLA